MLAEPQGRPAVALQPFVPGGVFGALPGWGMETAAVAFDIEFPSFAEEREIQPVFNPAAAQDDMLTAKSEAGGFQRGAHQVFYRDHIEDAEDLRCLPQAVQRRVAEADPGAAGIKDRFGQPEKRAQAVYTIKLPGRRMVGLVRENIQPAACRAAGNFGVTGYPFTLGLKAGGLVESYVRKIVFGSLLKRYPVPMVPRRDPQVARRL